MSAVPTAFAEFHATIALDSGRRERIMAAHHALRDFAEQDGPLGDVLQGSFLQGSVPHATAIWPLSGDFDVDVVLVLDARDPKAWLLDELRSPSDVLRWLAQRLRTSTRYAGKVTQGRRCVRVQYANDFHMDVVPAHQPSRLTSVLMVPDRDADEWVRTNPEGLIDWCRESNRRSEGRFVRVVKALKWWRDQTFAAISAPRSIVIEQLVGRHMPRRADSDAEALTRTLERIDAELWPWVPFIWNPSLFGEDLARDWCAEAYDLFRRRLRSAAHKARAALDAGDAARSRRLWSEFLGPEFPA